MLLSAVQFLEILSFTVHLTVYIPIKINMGSLKGKKKQAICVTMGRKEAGKNMFRLELEKELK